MKPAATAFPLRAFVIGAALCLTGSAALAADAMPAKPLINGYWEIDDSSRRGHPDAELTPAGQAIAKAAADAAAARGPRAPVGLGTFTCDYQPFPFMMGTSEPWALVATKDEVVQTYERPGMRPRHFYTDGRTLEDSKDMPVGGNGYSVGHWEGEDFVVQTRGLSPGGWRGGAYKTPTAVYTERFHVEPGNELLSVTYTIEDPANLAKPYSFKFSYARNPIGSTYAFGEFCDPHEDNGRTTGEVAQAAAAAEAAAAAKSAPAPAN